MPELLAPAGDLERLKIALIYGADAVYIGGPILGLRANAINFTFDEIKEGVEFAHKLNKKVYVTVNMVLHNKEVKAVDEYLKKLEELKVDAIIASDIYIIKKALDITNLEVHVSTQASTMNKETAKFYKNLGAKRIVLARELNKEDIKDIIDNVDIEVECFVHGAMCSSVSGRCAMSNFLTGRDANRGGCAQTCRWDYGLEDIKNNKIQGLKDFTFCAKDLSMLKYLKEMIDMNIVSFKIEGRMRSIYYIAMVVSIYRRTIDKYLKDKENFKYNKYDEITLRRCANRDSVPQFFDKEITHEESYYNGREEISNQDFLGIVLEYDEKTNIATIEQRNYFKKGDECIIFGPNHEEINYKFDEIIDEENNIIEIVRHPRQIVKIKVAEKLEKYDMLRIKYVDKI